jgi:glycerophosphoryl diester phosphodiesterase
MMKKAQILMLLVVAYVGLMSCSQRLHEGTAGQAGRTDKIVAALHDASTRYVVVVAHRGDWRNYPENSIPAIESVIRMGVDVMELDVKMTRDSVLVLSHDLTLNRTTTGSGDISDYTYEQLLAFDLKRGHGIAIPGLKIPTLRQALEVCKDRIVVNVDQGFDYYDQVLAITEELGMTDQVLIKNGQPLDKVQQRMSRHAHKMMYMPVVSVAAGSDMTTFNSYLASPEAVPIAFELCFDTLDDNVKNTARRVLNAGSKVWVNTIWGSLCGDHDDDRAYDSPDPDKVYGPILDLGTSIIQTDRPEFLIKYLEKKGRRRF